MTANRSAPSTPLARRGTTKAHGPKHDLDKFYTRPEVVSACLSRLDLRRYARIIEPSAGAGAFSRPLSEMPELGELLAFDLAPEEPGVVQRDWFSVDVRSPNPTLVVGNPPFGQQCSLALRFINHAFAVVGAQTVAFVLPRSFRKASVQRRIFSSAQLAFEELLPANSFLLDGSPYDVPAVFHVWERTAAPRPQRSLPASSRYFVFTRKEEPHDFAVRRIGGRAGHAFLETARLSKQSNYFVRLLTEDKPLRVVALINALSFPAAADGTGPKSLSKPELVAVFDAAYGAAGLRRAA